MEPLRPRKNSRHTTYLSRRYDTGLPQVAHQSAPASAGQFRSVQGGTVGERPGQHGVAAAGLSLQRGEGGAYRLAQAAADTDPVRYGGRSPCAPVTFPPRTRCTSLLAGRAVIGTCGIQSSSGAGRSGVGRGLAACAAKPGCRRPDRFGPLEREVRATLRRSLGLDLTCASGDQWPSRFF
jgi:hypothetical protein